MNLVHESDGTLWIATLKGVARYDGTSFAYLTAQDGLATNSVQAVHRDAEGIVWCGTQGAGVSGYDGTAWTTLDTGDGLAGDRINAIDSDPDGALRIATDKGLTFYRRSRTRPRVEILSVTTDRRHTDLSKLPPLTRGRRVTIEARAIEFKTLPERRQYRFRIIEEGKRGKREQVPYLPPTRSPTHEWTPGKSGTYRLEVQAIDRDLNYSEPAAVTVEVVPPFYLSAAFLAPAGGGGAALLLSTLVFATGYYRRRREVQAYEQLTVKELGDARKMQMDLFPKNPPVFHGMEMAGHCLTANTVGGDFYDFLMSPETGQLGLVVADVTGKGMKGAMNAVMSNGILHSAIRHQS